jgi:phosphomannomutase
VLISKDTRLSSPSLFKAAIETIPKNIKVYFLDISTTPMLYHFAGKLNVDLSIMITASHNPPEYNGFKISTKNVYPISGEEVYSMINNNSSIPVNTSRNLLDCEEITSAISYYINFLLSFINKDNFKRKLKIACDCANGTSGLILQQLLPLLPIEYEFLCHEPDGRFPNHNPNPLIFENIKHLSAKIKSGDYDIGVAFDGDADRVIFLDENGEAISPDLITIYVTSILKNKTSLMKVFIDTRSSISVEEELNKIGLKVERTRAGHLYMRRKLIENQNCFAGEYSGHYYYKENYNADAAILTMLLVLEKLSSEKQRISDLNKVRKYFSTGEVSYPITQKDKALETVEAFFANYKKEYIDGISIYDDNFYLNIRKSNTEDLIRLIIEAKTPEKAYQLKAQIEKLLKISA